MNSVKGNLLARHRVGYSFGTLVDRTIREQRREERRLAEQRPTKHMFQARNSCILDGGNYRIARRLLLLGRAQFRKRVAFRE
jgi:ribosomal protein S14